MIINAVYQSNFDLPEPQTLALSAGWSVEGSTLQRRPPGVGAVVESGLNAFYALTSLSASAGVNAVIVDGGSGVVTGVGTVYTVEGATTQSRVLVGFALQMGSPNVAPLSFVLLPASVSSEGWYASVGVLVDPANVTWTNWRLLFFYE